MAQMEKKIIAENYEKRENVRLDDYRPISVKEVKTGILNKATMQNYSKNGICFETDSALESGAEIYLGKDNMEKKVKKILF